MRAVKNHQLPGFQESKTKFEFQQTATAQITKTVQRLVNGKATGIHNKPNKVLKSIIHLMAPVLIDIFNYSIDKKLFPDDHKVPEVAPVYESRERKNQKNYISIAVLPTTANSCMQFVQLSDD